MMNKKRNLWVVGAIALAAGVFSACGGSSNGTEAESQKETLPTDGILGELPKAVFDFKKETLPALSKALEGKEIPGEVAEGLPITLEKNFTLNANREASTTGVFTAGASNETMVMNYYPVAFDADDNAIDVGRNIGFIDYPIKEGKKFSIGYYISVKAENAAKWARLAKIVIMDKTSDAYKQAEAQIKGE